MLKEVDHPLGQLTLGAQGGGGHVVELVGDLSHLGGVALDEALEIHVVGEGAPLELDGVLQLVEAARGAVLGEALVN
jgi:hypothetical protein